MLTVECASVSSEQANRKHGADLQTSYNQPCDVTLSDDFFSRVHDGQPCQRSLNRCSPSIGCLTRPAAGAGVSSLSLPSRLARHGGIFSGGVVCRAWVREFTSGFWSRKGRSLCRRHCGEGSRKGLAASSLKRSRSERVQCAAVAWSEKGIEAQLEWARDGMP
ncbi:uncharacterized protein K452DRAFT_171102 [Aplosporella prunicola CBS 121167]|uniref:Uncharacterized protein n=1 Tax=Aplosporella prunicola CBS 121167 TaxID=1176127 RepID=A0A6A6BLJ4_9PEZI|nr:uncharacterized protein K452DRAFT_171102 [Aplosporella prunicola CBS 121167]KAF2143441.1 hypothetical protein K452DRAFT_171102 [Aplosporella prunicola CBS 121167]